MIDISNIPQNAKIYDGSDVKWGITIDGVDYIIKPSNDNLSVFSEYIASKFINSLGIPCQEVELGTYNGMIVAIIKDFTSHTGYTLHSYKDTKQTSVGTDLSEKQYTYSDVLYVIDKHTKMSKDNKEYAKRAFWNMFICDAILANRDRHWGNWGYLSNGNAYWFAPIYDNGNSLFPNVSLKLDEFIDKTTREQFCKDRVYTFPASLLGIERKDRVYRSNYADILSDLRFNRIMAEQVKGFRQCSVWEIINLMLEIVNSIDILDYYLRRFYVTIVALRFGCLVLRKPFHKLYQEVEKYLSEEV